MLRPGGIMSTPDPKPKTAAPNAVRSMAQSCIHAAGFCGSGGRRQVDDGDGVLALFHSTS